MTIFVFGFVHCPLRIKTTFRKCVLFPSLGDRLRRNSLDLVRFLVLTAASMKMAGFWVVAPCSLVEVYHRFRGACSLHHRDDEYRRKPSSLGFNS
jgi:hypothetical protein